ncbi:MAG: site-2 protease family protein [Actinobacteria bacterium]|nr:site-2 protease family protein [Actinomycetota bacterium]
MKDPLGDAAPVETRKAVSGILVIVASLVLLVALRPSLLVTVAIIVGLVVTIMLHEWGHYYAAKKAGMKVTEFFLGFGPRIWSFRRGETEYGIKAIPAGGYVRIIGMTNLEAVDPADEARTYRQSTTPKKLTVVLAGIAVNLVLVLVLTYTILVVRGRESLSTQVDRVTAGSPARAAGIRADDRIVSIDGTPVGDWETLSELVRPNAGTALTVVVLRDGREVPISVTPEMVEGAGRIGVTSRIVSDPESPITALPKSFAVLVEGTKQVAEVLGRIFSPSGLERYGKTVTNTKGGFTGQERPRSVIGIVAEGDDIVRGDFVVLLGLLASINLFLALFNALPLPPLDGGHAAIACYEGIASKVTRRRVRVDYRRVMPVAAIVMMFLLMFGLSAMYLDIRGL